MFIDLMTPRSNKRNKFIDGSLHHPVMEKKRLLSDTDNRLAF